MDAFRVAEEGPEMFRKVALGSVAVFVVWSILDFVLHGVVLGST
jgi:hypothetical protein